MEFFFTENSSVKATHHISKVVGMRIERIRKIRKFPTTEHCPEQSNKKLVKRIAKTLTDGKRAGLKAENRLR